MPRRRVSGTSRPTPAAYSPRSGRREQHHQQGQHDYKQPQPGNPHVVPGGPGWPCQASGAPATPARNTSPLPSSPPYSPPEVISGDDVWPTLPDGQIAVKIEDGIGEGPALGESRRERGNRQRSLSAPPPAGGGSRNMYYEEKVDRPVLPGQGQDGPLFRYLPGEFDEESDDDEESQVYQMDSTYRSGQDVSDISSDVTRNCGDMLGRRPLEQSSQEEEGIEPSCSLNIHQGGTEESFEEAIEAVRAAARARSTYRRNNRESGWIRDNGRERFRCVAPQNSEAGGAVPNGNTGGVNHPVDTQYESHGVQLGWGPVGRAVMEGRYIKKVRHQRCSAWGSLACTPGEQHCLDYEGHPSESEGPVGDSPLSRKWAGRARHAPRPEIPPRSGATHPPFMGNGPYHPQESRHNQPLYHPTAYGGGLRPVHNRECGTLNQFSIHVNAPAYDSDGLELESGHRRYIYPPPFTTSWACREGQELLSAAAARFQPGPSYINRRYDSVEPRPNGYPIYNIQNPHCSQRPSSPVVPEHPQASLHPQAPLHRQELQAPSTEVHAQSAPPNPPQADNGLRAPRVPPVALNAHQLEHMTKWGLDHILNGGTELYTVGAFAPDYLPPGMDWRIKHYLTVYMKGIYFRDIRELWSKAVSTLRQQVEWGNLERDTETELRKAIGLIIAAIGYKVERDSTQPAHDNPSTRSPGPKGMPPTPRRASGDQPNDSNQTPRPPGPGSDLTRYINKMREYLETEGVQEDTIIRVVIEALTAELKRRSTVSGNVPADEGLAAKTMGSGEVSRGSQVEARKAEVNPTLQSLSPLVSTSERRPSSDEPKDSSHRNNSSDSPGPGGNNEPGAEEVTLPASEPLRVGGKKRRCESDGGAEGPAESKRQRRGESSVGLLGMSEFEGSVPDGRAKARRMSSRIRKKRSEER